MMMHNDIIATGWDVTLREECSLEHLHVWHSTCANNCKTELQVFVELMKKEFREFVIDSQVELLCNSS